MTHELVTWLGGVLDRIEQEAPEVHAASCPAVESSGMSYAVSLDACSCGWPQRVRADVAAKRTLLAETIQPYLGADTTAGRVAWLALRTLALPFADHPGYRDEWRPQ